MSTKYNTRITRLTVLPEGEPIYGECTTQIEIVDEASGEFIKLTQEGGHTELGKSIAFEPVEWQSIKAAVDQMLGYIKLNENKNPNA